MTIKTTVRVAFIDVGQGDTIVVSVPETHEAVIIDCLDAEAVISYLEKYEIHHIRGLIVTHLHLDHYKGIMGLIDNVKSELNLICEHIFSIFRRSPEKSGNEFKMMKTDIPIIHRTKLSENGNPRTFLQGSSDGQACIAIVSTAWQNSRV